MKKNGLYLGIAACAMALPLGIQAQEEVALEELVVTGSYIKRGKFESPSPIEVITADQIRQQGAPSMAQVVRDLSISQNTDTVANVLGTQDGGQDSATATFNLRGLGPSSTLTLFDGRRTITDNVQSIVPDIAIEQVQIVLDGGATAYGSDAVAGVVNFIPIKEYNGVRIATYYTQDDNSDFKEPKISILGGKSFDNGLNWVAAIDYHKRTPLLRHNRPTYLYHDDDDSVFGQPGTYASAFTDFHRDPNCGATTSDPLTEDDTDQGAFQSGVLTSPGTFGLCRFEFGEFQDYLREVEESLAYTNLSFEVSDALTLEFQANFTWRESTGRQSPSTGNSTSNADLVIPSSFVHPDSPYPFTVRPSGSFWRPFGKYGTLPSILVDGSAAPSTEAITQRYKFGGDYTFGDTSWSGQTWLSYQNTKVDSTNGIIHQTRFEDALRGFGGPDCVETPGGAGMGSCEFFNPFYSSHPGDAIPGTVNSQALVDWIYFNETYKSSDTDFVYLDSFVTGELFDMPAGAVVAAVGLQYRNTDAYTSPSPLNLAGEDYNSPAQSFVTDLSSEVNAVFAEFDIPILDVLGVNLAIRREEFKDFDLETTVPKIAVRYEPISGLAFRASYGEGFVAPSLGERGPRQFDSQCVEVFTATPDPFINVPITLGGTPDSLQGATSCFSANPMVGAEESKLKNIGVSWQATDGLELSADFQIVEFEDRIISLASADLVNNDYDAYLAAIANGTFTSLGVPGQDPRIVANLDLPNWVASGLADPLVERNATTNEVTQVTRIPVNANSNKISVWDLAARYDIDTDAGFFILSSRWSAFHRYSFQDGQARWEDGVGDQNADSALAPPIPRWKGNIRLSWLNNNHSASINADYISHVDFDDPAVDLNAPITVGSPPATANRKNITLPKDISSHTTIDVRYSYMFDNLLGGEMQFTLGSNNVTDSYPDPLPIAGGLETRLHDPFGRTFYIEIGYEPTF